MAEGQTGSTSNARTRNQNGGQATSGDPKNDRLLALVKEAIALIPGTAQEVSMLKRYSSEQWLERMTAAREKMVQIHDALTAGDGDGKAT